MLGGLDASGDRGRVDRQVGQPPAVLGVPDADFAGPVGGEDLRLVVGEDGLERQVAEWLELALLAAILVPERHEPIAAGREQPPILGEPDARRRPPPWAPNDLMLPPFSISQS